MIIGLVCALNAMDPSPPMYLTLDNRAHTVQVSMAGQSYSQTTLEDGGFVYWHFTGSHGRAVVTRLNPADGSLIIDDDEQVVSGSCHKQTSAPKPSPKSPSMLLVTNQWGQTLYTKPYASFDQCMTAKQQVSGQGQQQYAGGWVSKDRDAPRATCVPK